MGSQVEGVIHQGGEGMVHQGREGVVHSVGKACSIAVGKALQEIEAAGHISSRVKK